jgi:hypothetical protein
MRNLIGGLSRLPQVAKDVIRVNVNTKSTAEHCDKTPGHSNRAKLVTKIYSYGILFFRRKKIAGSGL